jgi:hypothetical protein
MHKTGKAELPWLLHTSQASKGDCGSIKQGGATRRGAQVRSGWALKETRIAVWWAARAHSERVDPPQAVLWCAANEAEQQAKAPIVPCVLRSCAAPPHLKL